MIDSPVKHATPNHFHGMDTLRAAAIMLVFMYHYQVFVSHQATFGWASTVGWTGVDLFFVLSGYLISNPIFAGMVAGRQLSLKAFYARRFLRTLPDFYLVLALYFLFPLTMGGKTPPPLWRFLTFTQNLWLQPGTAFSHAWSLCIEEQFYLLVPVVALLATRLRGSIRWAWIALFALILVAITTRSLLWLDYGREADGAISGYYPNIYYSTFCRFDEFLPGIAVALLKNFHSTAWATLIQHGQKLLATGVLAVAAMFYLTVDRYYIDGYGYGFFMTGFGYSLIAWSFALLVVAALSPTSWLYRIRIPGAATLAAWSYAIYLSHKPMAVIVQRNLQDFALDPAIIAAIIIVACLAVGAVIYRLIETPFMRLRARRYPSIFSKSGDSDVAAKAASVAVATSVP